MVKLRKWLGLAVTLGVCLAPSMGVYADNNPSPDQIKTLAEISHEPETDWPKLLRKHHNVIDGKIIQYLGNQANRALAAKTGKPGVDAACDQNACYFALLADDAAREIHAPIIWRLQLADMYWKQGLAAQAYDMLDNVTATDPLMPEPHMLGGNYLMQIGHLEEARVQFDKVLKMNRNSEEALQHLAEIDLDEKRLPEAKVSVKKLLSQYPNNAKGKEIEATLAKVEPHVAQLAPQKGYVPPAEAVELEEKGRQELFGGNLTMAEATARAAVAKAPQYPKSSALLGDVLMRESKYAEAAVAYEHAASLTPPAETDNEQMRKEKAESFRYEGFAYAMAFNVSKKQDDLQKAIDAYQVATTLEPTNVQYKGEFDRVSKLKT